MFPKFPYTDFHRLNADWILEKVLSLSVQIADALQRVNTAVQSITDCVKVTAQNFTAAEKAQARTNIGAAATADIPNVSDVVRTSPQTLSTAAQTQARTNIGAAATADIPNVSDVVRTSPQTLSTAAQTQARTNIGAASASDVSTVVRTTPQTLTPAAQTQARTNIGAASASAVSDVVRTSAQTLTTAEQTQARTNIGAAATADIPNVSDVVRTSAQSLTDAEKTRARVNISAAATADLYNLTNQTVRFIEESESTPASVAYPPATPAQMEDFRDYFHLLKHAAPEALYSIALLGQIIGPLAGYPRVRLERVEDGNGGAYFKVSQRASLDSPAGNVDCRVSGVATPTASNDAVNKDYVDALKPFVITVTFNGGNLTGDKTDAQMEDAINNNRHIVVSFDGAKYYCTWAIVDNHDVSLVAGYANIVDQSCAILKYDSGAGWQENAL